MLFRFQIALIVSNFSIITCESVFLVQVSKFIIMHKKSALKLFNLVKSLSPAEKRHFKLFVGSKAKSNKYLDLFGLIDAHDRYFPEKNIQILYPGKKGNPSRYAELKTYLFNLILKSLRSFHEGKSKRLALKGMLQDVDILYGKMLFDSCKELLIKAKKLAIKYEFFTDMLEVLDWEKKIAVSQSDINFFKEELASNLKEEQKMSQKLTNRLEFKTLYYSLFYKLRMKSLIRNDKDRKDLSESIEKNTLLERESTLSYSAKSYLYRNLFLYHFLMINHNEFLTFSKKNVLFLESNPAMIERDIVSYIGALGNFIISCGLQDRYYEVYQTLLKLKRVKPKNFHQAYLKFSEYYSNNISLLKAIGEFAEAKKVLNRHSKEQLKFYDVSIYNKDRFLFQYFYIYFGCQEYEKAFDYFKEWENYIVKTNSREDMQSLSKILELIFHYELGNFILLESLIRSTYRYLKKRNRLLLFEQKILKFLKKSLSNRSSFELLKTFQVLEKDLKDLEHISSENIMLKYFDFVSWLQSKTEDKTFAQVIRERYLNNKPPNEPILLMS